MSNKLENKKKEIVLRIDEQTFEKINQLRDAMCAISRNETIRRCINEMHNKTFDYKFAIKNRLFNPKNSDPRKSVAEQELEVGKNICQMLGGTVGDEGGSLNCKYDVYEVIGDKVESYGTSLPLKWVTEELLNSQYKPSKEAVLEIMKK